MRGVQLRGNGELEIASLRSQGERANGRKGERGNRRLLRFARKGKRGLENGVRSSGLSGVEVHDKQ